MQQFDLYLDISVLQYNLAAITEKVVDISLQTVILKKLNQIYPLGLDDGVLQLLGSTSRVATIDDIRKWSINRIDTLYSLLDPKNGPWDPDMSEALIMRYLSTGDHYLESAEINAIGSNICTLNISVLQTITAESLKSVLSPDLSSCSIEQKSVLYSIANSSFSNEHRNALTFYQLIIPYLGGAPLEDIQALSTQNISMDITTFISLNPAVLKMLNVSTVRGLIGVNIAELQLFENSSVVQSWVSQQNQSDLNTLNLGIINHNPCFGVDSQQFDGEIASGNVSAVLCNFSILDYACSSAVVLTSDYLATLLTCELSSSMTYSKEAWRRFLQNFAGPLDEALDRFSITNLSSIQSGPNILDAIGEVIISNFNTEQLRNVTFVSEWFQVAVLGLLSSEQKAQFLLQADSGVLRNDSAFREVFSNIVTSLDLNQLGRFFTAFNETAIQMNLSIPTAISEIILNVTLLDLAPDFQSFSPQNFSLWFQTYLSSFLPAIGPNTLSVIPMSIGCNSYREIVKGLDNVYSHLTTTQSNIVFKYTLGYLQYQSSLSYYSSGSFFMFLNPFFLSFGFPDLKDFLSLIPAVRQAEILNSISVEELSEFLNRPNTVSDGAELCTLLNNYNMTNQYLAREPVLSSALASLTLACVWPQALRASSPADVEQWFNVRLVNYLPYLTSHLISSTQLSNASCLAYRKLVYVLGNNYNFSATHFTPADVYSSIRAYLTSNDGRPRCFNSSDPLLNSTAWFADNIGFFITFISVSDIHSFLSENMTSEFLENSENLQLFNNSGIAGIVLEYYTKELYTRNPDFSPLRLPAELLCHSPSSMFDALGDSDVQAILRSINNYCTGISPEVTAVLVAKFPNISASTIQSLGSQCVGLTVGQILSAPANAIISSLSTLSNIGGWDQGQVNALVQSIINAGFNISTASTLVSLGTLISGVPSATISDIPYSEILSLSQNPTFIDNILSAPTVLQETFVQKIISVDQPEVIAIVPGALVTYIPLVLLTSLSSENISLINTQSWSQEQKTKDLVKACRPRAGRDKVLLEEAQLVCMYNYVKDDPSVSFTDVPSDLLLYYSYENIQKENCQSYFTALGSADFSILSSVLDKQTILFDAAKDCLVKHTQ
ncbi:mesothelin-like protein [Clarias magur]|uniref:Mesothelin-like protein n=1 Tax=Clarias magur TaxID=1594786 RepID=A0A8J4TN45_CLAMG|nr:mesothelin-like protein [Clarias magur]